MPVDPNHRFEASLRLSRALLSAAPLQGYCVAGSSQSKVL
jgi:hypothetical protein